MSEHDQWQDCPPGLLAGMASQLRREQRRGKQLPLIVGVAVLLVIGLGYAALRQPDASPLPRLTCDDTISLFADFRAGNLDAQTAIRVREHLSHCPHCRERYEQEYPSDARETKPDDSLVASR